MRLLIVAPERIDLPLTGGSLRTGFIARGLARRFETLVLVSQSSDELEQLLGTVPDFASARWLSIHESKLQPSRSFTNKVRSRYDRWKERREMNAWQGSFRNWHIGPLRSWRFPLLEACESFQPDAVIIEHTRYASTLKYIKRMMPNCVRVINSHNVDSELHRSVIDSPLQEDKTKYFVEQALNHERHLGNLADALWACSEADAQRYKNIGIRCAEIAAVPNGIDTEEVAFRSLRQTSVPRLLFIGTLCYEPNEQGLLWFYHNVWPLLKLKIPDLHWRIVGRYTSPAVEKVANDDGIELFVDAPSTAPHLDESSVFVCPLFFGSGTRLKLLEAFSAGIPVVSTAIGAEGLNAQDGEHYLRADDAEAFVRSVTEFLENSAVADRIRNQARQFAMDRYDWESIVGDASKRLLTYVQAR